MRQRLFARGNRKLSLSEEKVVDIDYIENLKILPHASNLTQATWRPLQMAPYKKATARNWQQSPAEDTHEGRIQAGTQSEPRHAD